MVRRATRRTQPHRKGKQRPAGPALRAMRRGRPAYAPNPQDTKRQLQKKRRKKVRVPRAYPR